MKLILLKEVEGVGDIGAMVDVADGYGRNFLLPKGLAVAATARNTRQIEHEQRLRDHRVARARQEAQTFAQQLEAVECRFSRKAGDEGKLFGSVTAMDVADRLKEAGYEVDRRRIQMDQPLKSLGNFTVPIRLQAAVSAEVKVSIVAEE